MPIGVLVNSAAALAGGALGSILSHRIPDSMREPLPVLFGYCAMAIGINAIIKVQDMTAVVLALLLGFCVGHLLKLEKRSQVLCARAVKAAHLKQVNNMPMYITLVALLCFSGFGWYGVLTESISGSPDVLFSKSALDFFTAVLFGATLGRAVCLIPFAQFAVLLSVFLLGKLIAPMMSQEAFLNLCACGGVITLATGFRIANIKTVPIIDIIPALILIWPMTVICGIIL